MNSDHNVEKILIDDGVSDTLLEPGHQYENLSKINVKTLEENLKFDNSWAVRIIYNKRFGGVIIKQNPGEGNRLHYHPDADEIWVILDGEYEWQIDDKVQTVTKGDIVVVKEKVWHKIKAVGDKPAIRLAITKPNVDHIYED